MNKDKNSHANAENHINTDKVYSNIKKAVLL